MLLLEDPAIDELHGGDFTSLSYEPTNEVAGPYGGTTYTVGEGKHSPRPYIHRYLPYHPNGISAQVKFHSNCAYILDNGDQGDWNKLIGIWSGISKDTSVRWGWRYNPSSGNIQICPFIHHENEEGAEDNAGAGSNYIEIPLNTWFSVNITIDRENDQYQLGWYENLGNLGMKAISRNLSGKYNGLCLMNMFWFGGNREAPHDVTVEYATIDKY